MVTITITVPDQGPPVYDVKGDVGVAAFLGVLEIVKASVLAEAAAPPPSPLQLPNGHPLPNLRGPR
jgi:hypothetical protein